MFVLMVLGMVVVLFVELHLHVHHLVLFYNHCEHKSTHMVEIFYTNGLKGNY